MTHHPTDDANAYETALTRLQEAGDAIEEALNLLAAIDDYDRRAELSYALGVVRGVSGHYIEKAGTP